MGLTRPQRSALYVALLAWANGRTLGEQAELAGFTINPGDDGGEGKEAIWPHILEALVNEKHLRNRDGAFGITLPGVGAAVEDLSRHSISSSRGEIEVVLRFVQMGMEASSTVMDALREQDVGFSRLASRPKELTDELGLIREVEIEKIVSEIEQAASTARAKMAESLAAHQVAVDAVVKMTCSLCLAGKFPACPDSSCAAKRHPG